MWRLRYTILPHLTGWYYHQKGEVCGSFETLEDLREILASTGEFSKIELEDPSGSIEEIYNAN